MVLSTVRKVQKLTLPIMFQILFLTTALFAATVANAATYYVATNGSDSNPGSLSQPFRTIAQGASVLKRGDVLYIRGGTYDATIGGGDIPAGSPGQHTIIAGYQNERPIIRPSAFPYYMVFMLSRHYINVQDLVIDASNGGPEIGCAHIEHNVNVQRVTCLNAARDGFRF